MVDFEDDDQACAAHDPEGCDVTPVQDPDLYKDACTVFGDAGALVWLRAFHKDLAEHLDRVAQNPSDRAAVQDIAHRTAGRAGLLGFLALAETSARLEDALRRNEGVAAALDHWTRQGRRVAALRPDDGDEAAPDAHDSPPHR